jgi:hypothetical protein
MARCLVVRTGGTWHGSSGPSSVMQSQANDTAIAQVLAEHGHEVLCGGRLSGSPGGLPTLGWSITPAHGIEGNMPEVDRWCLAAEAWRPDLVVNVTGGATTTFTPGVRGLVHDAGWRYGWVLMEFLKRCPTPRVVCVTDVRCYPREQELTYLPGSVPCAVLSQEQRSYEFRVLRKRFRVDAVHAKLETFRTRKWPRLPVNRDAPWDVTCLAHAHQTDARIAKGRAGVWKWILRDLPDSGLKWRIVGNGWPEETGIRPVQHVGVSAVLHDSVCGPLVGMGTGWHSPKYSEYALSGCVPLPYGMDTELYRYGSYDEDHGAFANSARLVEVARWLRGNLPSRERYVDQALERAKFDPSVLLACVEDAEGRAAGKYGGYEEVTT